MRAAAVIFASAAGLGCGADVTIVAPPDLTGARSLILAVRDESKPLQIQAFSLEDGAKPTFQVQVDPESYEIDALVYASSLAELGLAPGPIDVVTDEPKKPIPKATHEYVLIGATWQQETIARPPAIAGATIRGTASPCATFSHATLSRNPTQISMNAWAFAFPWKDGAVLAATKQGESFLIAADGTVTPASLPPGLTPTAGVLDAMGGVWVASLFGELWHGLPGAEPMAWTRVQHFSPVSQIDFMDVAPDGTEVVVLSRDGTVARWSTRGGWTRLAQLPDAAGATTDGGGVLRLGLDDVLAVNPSQRGVMRIRGGMTEIENVDAESAFTSLERVEGVGIVLGSGLGELFVRRADRWISLGPSGSRFWVLGMGSYEGGFIWGAPYGTIGQYVGEQFCPLINVVTFATRFVIPLGRDVLALGEDMTPPSPRGAILRRN